MLESTEQLLDNLHNKFVEAKEGKTRGGKPKINHRLFVEARGAGQNLADSVKAAGSKGKSEKALTIQGVKILNDHPEYRVAITDIIEDKKHQILGAMTQTKIEDASLTSQAVAFGILTDKGELLAGRPTARTEENLNLDKLERGALLAFILGRLSTGGKALPGK